MKRLILFEPKMNLAVRGLSAKLGEVPADTFFKDQHPDLKADTATRDSGLFLMRSDSAGRSRSGGQHMANPPFNLKDWRGPDTAMRGSANLRPEGTPQVTSEARNTAPQRVSATKQAEGKPQIANEVRDKLVHDGRWNGYETPPTGNANYAWILHMVRKLSDWSGATKRTRQGCPEGERGGANQNGVAGFVLANGSMSTNTKGEGEICQKMVEMSQTLYAQMDEAKELDQAITKNLKSLGYGRK